MASLLKRKETSLILIAVCFGVVVIPYFIEMPILEIASTKLVLMVSVLNAMSILLALYAQTKRSLTLVNQRAKGWPYQLYLVITIYLMAGVGFIFGQSSDQFNWFQYAILMPTGSVIYSMLTFYMASACARAFRARSPQATLLLIAGILVLLGQAPLTGAYIPFFGDARLYLTGTFAMAASRMFNMSVTIGAVVLGVRIITGKEVSAMGFEGGE